MADSKFDGGRGASPPDTPMHPVEDTVAKVDDSVAVGEDLDFQRRWWKFERVVWIFFGLIVVCDLLGVFGRGYMAKAERKTADQSVDLHYDKIERANTPSIMSVKFGPSAIRNGEVRLFVSTSVVNELGAQRVVPQPAASAVGLGGVTYTFPVAGLPVTVDIALAPSYPGVHAFTLGVPGSEMVTAKVTVLP
jgi:hypothetical protein